jgi:hypothetical protein
MRNCVTKCGGFRGFAQPNLILPLKCCDSFSGLDAHDQVLKGVPVRDFTTIVSESDLARQLNRSVPPSTVSRRVGRLATHQNLAAFRIDSVHAWLARRRGNQPLMFRSSGRRFARHSSRISGRARRVAQRTHRDWFGTEEFPFPKAVGRRE